MCVSREGQVNLPNPRIVNEIGRVRDGKTALPTVHCLQGLRQVVATAVCIVNTSQPESRAPLHHRARLVRQ
jgi:hypothetical protein